MNRPVIFLSLIVTGIVLGSLLPIHLGDYDKILHIGAYGFLLFSLCWLFPKHKYVWIIAVLSVGIGMEILQRFSFFHREFSYRDIGADGIGVSVGLLSLFIKDKLYGR